MKSLFILFFICCLSVSVLTGQNRAEIIRTKLFDHQLEEVLVVAHRGDWRYAPENSLPAIDHAIRIGVDIIELDVQRTQDGHLILMHDEYLDRTTTGTGKIADKTLDYIRTLKLKNGYGFSSREIVPTLEEALLHVKGKVLVNLDKADRYFEEVYALMKKTNTTRQVIMKGRQSPEEVKRQFGKYLEDVIYMPVMDLEKEGIEEQVKGFLKEMELVAFEFIYSNPVNPLPEKMGKLLKGKSLIWYNTLWDSLCGGHDDDLALGDPERIYGFLIKDLGARIIQTDRPAFLLEYLTGKGLR